MRSSLWRSVTVPSGPASPASSSSFGNAPPSQLLRPLRGHVDVQKPALDGRGRLLIGLGLVRRCFSDMRRRRDVIEKLGMLVHDH